jgi:hypothetical protein
MGLKSKWPKRFLIAFSLSAILYLILLIPDSAPPVPPTTDREPFAWNQDQYWSLLESQFKQAREAGCVGLSSRIAIELARNDSLLTRLQVDTLAPGAPIFQDIESSFFTLGVYLAACPERSPEYLKAFGRMRTDAKNQCAHWDMNSRAARDCIYRLLYGGRTAVEEALLQSPTKALPEAAFENDEPSATPSATILGIKIHSGDILVSRGGAPTSALIARGNDYPGNFSHVALAYVDESSAKVSLIESHIEKGVAIADLDTYLNDTKLRIMILRLRSDLPALQADPLLPHRAAAFELARAKSEHIPYDFAMDIQDRTELFCSEVASEAYAHFGVTLWMGLSHMSSPGVKSWLSAFGVRHFTTQEPADLEYDPQLRVVAEWRDYETLLKDRLDNAVVDIMLESADKGEILDYDWYLLPAGRILKAYSFVLNKFGAVGPVPEGMNATAALRNKWFSRKHDGIKARLTSLAQNFEQDNGYSPPYWELIKLARLATSPVDW